jgi:hypothetical protein
MISKDLNELRATLANGQRLSMQGSYSRRAPAKASVPYLHSARDGLQNYVQKNPDSAEAWELLSRAEECLLNIGNAITCLEEAMALSGRRDRRSLKRLALLREAKAEWSAIPLTPDQLRELGDFLVERGAGEEQFGRTLDKTRDWLESSGLANTEAIIEALADRGGFTDFQVLYNVVRG